MTDTPRHSDDTQPQPDEFVQLFVAHQRRILAFICSLLTNLADAEDVAQEVSRVLWEKFGEFRPGTDFGAWALRIAQLKVLEHRRRAHRKPLIFDDALLQQLAADAIDLSADIERQQRALDDCLLQLSPQHRQLLQDRYRPRGTLIAAAAKFGRSVVTTRRALRQIHAMLLDCIRRTAEGEARS